MDYFASLTPVAALCSAGSALQRLRQLRARLEPIFAPGGAPPRKPSRLEARVLALILVR